VMKAVLYFTTPLASEISTPIHVTSAASLLSRSETFSMKR